MATSDNVSSGGREPMDQTGPRRAGGSCTGHGAPAAAAGSVRNVADQKPVRSAGLVGDEGDDRIPGAVHRPGRI
jgi:hypothetical protein